MKHTRSILNQIHSEPSFESMDILDIPLISPAEGMHLALESAEILNTVDNQFDELSTLGDKEDGLNTLVDYVESEVNGPTEEGPLRTATQNEVALVEQAVAANTDGTGIDEDETLPALESAVGSTISLEGVKDTLSKFATASGEMVMNIIKGVGKFMKVVFTRLGSLRTGIEKLEKNLSSGELNPGEYTVSDFVGYFATRYHGKFISTSKGLVPAFKELTAGLETYAVTVPKKIDELHSQFTTTIAAFITDEKGTLRGEGATRDEVGKKVAAELNQANDFIAKNFPGKDYLGGMKFDYEKPTLTDDLKASAKTLKNAVPVQHDSDDSDNENDVSFKVDSVADIKAILSQIKSSITLLKRISENDNMWAVRVLTTAYGPGGHLANLIVDGSDSTAFRYALRDVNAFYIKAFTKPAMIFINHYLRSADSVLDLFNAAYKVPKAAK